MRWEAWAFSARLGWQNRWLRWSAVASMFVVLGGSGWFLAKMVPVRRQAETVVMHYNLYLGIDDVRAWAWIFVLPGVWAVMTLADLAFAFGLFRTDPQFSLSLSALALLWSLPWAIALYYLTLANT